MEEKKTTYLNEVTDRSNAELTEAANIFSQLSPEAQNEIIDLMKSLLSQNH